MKDVQEAREESHYAYLCSSLHPLIPKAYLDSCMVDTALILQWHFTMILQWPTAKVHQACDSCTSWTWLNPVSSAPRNLLLSLSCFLCSYVVQDRYMSVWRSPLWIKLWETPEEREISCVHKACATLWNCPDAYSFSNSHSSSNFHSSVE